MEQNGNKSVRELKDCPCCKQKKTTENSTYIGSDDTFDYFNCNECDSTFVMSIIDDCWDYPPGLG